MFDPLNHFNTYDIQKWQKLAFFLRIITLCSTQRSHLNSRVSCCVPLEPGAFSCLPLCHLQLRASSYQEVVLMATLTKTYPIKVTKFPIESVIYLQPVKIQSLGTFLCKVCWHYRWHSSFSLRSARSQEPLPHNSQKSLSWVVSMLQSV